MRSADRKVPEAESTDTCQSIGDITGLFEAAEDARKAFAKEVPGYTGPWFRGEAPPREANWELIPKVFRPLKELGEASPVCARAYENGICEAFRAQARSRHANCPQEEDFAGWLALMQHYGVPTRLLDWTGSILVAAFFACQRVARQADDEPNGVVWALDPVALNEKIPHYTSFARIPVLSTYHRDYTEMASGDRSPWEPYCTVNNLVRSAFYPDADRDCVVAVAPAEIDPRMTVQQSMFTIHGLARSMASLSDMNDTPPLLQRYEVAGDRKADLREALSLLGIRVSTLFPDLEHLAVDVPRMFRKRAGWAPDKM